MWPHSDICSLKWLQCSHFYSSFHGFNMHNAVKNISASGALTAGPLGGPQRHFMFITLQHNSTTSRWGHIRWSCSLAPSEQSRKPRALSQQSYFQVVQTLTDTLDGWTNYYFHQKAAPKRMKSRSSFSRAVKPLGGKPQCLVTPRCQWTMANLAVSQPETQCRSGGYDQDAHTECDWRGSLNDAKSTSMPSPTRTMRTTPWQFTPPVLKAEPTATTGLRLALVGELTRQEEESLEPMVTNLVESIWMSLFVCSWELIQPLYTLYFLALFSEMSSYVAILACRRRRRQQSAVNAYMFKHDWIKVRYAKPPGLVQPKTCHAHTDSSVANILATTFSVGHSMYSRLLNKRIGQIIV